MRIVRVLTILQFVYSPFFQLNCCFRAITRSVISQPTDGFLPRRRRRPLASTTTEQPRKNNGENRLCFDDVTVCLLTFFQLNCYFRAVSRSVISQPTAGFLPRCHRRPLACITIERRRKKNGENCLCCDDFTVCLLTFFPIKLLFSCYLAIFDIAAHR